MPKTPEFGAHNEHYSIQTGHRERGIINRAMLEVEGQAQPDIVSRGQIYIDRRLHVPRYTKDGKR